MRPEPTTRTLGMDMIKISNAGDWGPRCKLHQFDYFGWGDGKGVMGGS